MEIRTYRHETKGFVSIWEHHGESGKAYSATPDGAEQNAIRQAKRMGLNMTDCNGNPQQPGITRRLLDDPIKSTLAGGSRPGAGRPVTGRKQRNFQLTDTEHGLVKKYVKLIREGNKMEDMKIRVEHKERGLEEIYDTDDFADALDKFCTKYGWELAEEVTVTEVGGFYDKNR